MSSDDRRWTIRVCSHGQLVHWGGHPNTLGGWQHTANGRICGSGTTHTLEVVPAPEVERLRECLVDIAEGWVGNVQEKAQKALNAR